MASVAFHLNTQLNNGESPKLFEGSENFIDTVDSLTTNGSDGTSAGVFAGDAGLNSLANQLDDIAHASYNGESIVDYGITLDSHGHLQIDADQFNDAMKSDPDGLTA